MVSCTRVGVILTYKPYPHHDTNYLCVYQAESKLWGFPKGRLELYDKSYSHGASRELLEETRVDIPHKDLSSDDMIRLHIGSNSHYYFMKAVDSKPQIVIDRDEIIDYAWMTLDQLSVRGVSRFTERVVDIMRMGAWRDSKAE